MRPNDFASYLLAIGICNLLLYFAFYIIMKVNEKGWNSCSAFWGQSGALEERKLFCPYVYASEVWVTGWLESLVNTPGSCLLGLCSATKPHP